MSVDDSACEHWHGSGRDEIRLLLVDDHAGVRAGLTEVLSEQADFSVAGECEDGSQVGDAFARLRPDVVLMDVSMPVMDGLTATRALTAAHPDARVVILTSHGSEARPAAVAAGAQGFMTKAADTAALMRCIRSVVAGCSCCLEAASA